MQSVAVSQLSSKYLKVKSTVVATGAGSGQQVDMFSKGEADFGTMADITVLGACRGTGRYEGRQITNIRGVAGSFQVLYFIVTDAKYGIEKMEDLKGSGYAVSFKPISSPLFTKIGSLIYEFYGMDPTGKDVNEEPHTAKAEGFAALKEGRIKVLAEGQPEPGPDPYYLEADMTIDMRMIPMSVECIEYIDSKIGGFLAGSVPAGLYKGITEPTTTGGICAGFYANVDLPDDYVYELTKLIFETPTREEFVSYGPHLKLVTTERVGYLLSPYHAGAVKYYKEIGAWTDEAEKQQKVILAKVGMAK